MSVWITSGFSHVGKSHESEGLENQDSFTFLEKGCASILIVSDGAGTAEQAKNGSLILVNSLKKTCENLPDSLFENPVSRLWLLSSAIETGIERARNKLAKGGGIWASLFSQKPKVSIDSFSATLVLVISSGMESAIFHIGDGYGGVSNFGEDGSLQNQYVSLPQNGEFDNETYFFTDRDWRKHFRVTAVDAPVNYMFAMSDGADPFMISQQRDSLDERVNTQLYKAMGGAGIPMLDQIFTKSKVHAVSHDDSTLLVSRL